MRSKIGLAKNYSRRRVSRPLGKAQLGQVVLRGASAGGTEVTTEPVKVAFCRLGKVVFGRRFLYVEFGLSGSQRSIGCRGVTPHFRLEPPKQDIGYSTLRTKVGAKTRR